MTGQNSKTCTKCGETKPVCEFYKHPGCKGGHRPECKECIKTRTRAWYADTAEVRRAYNRERYKNPEYVEYIRVNGKARYLANREAKMAYQRAYHKAHPEVSKRAWTKRRAQLAELEQKPYTRRDIYDRDGGKCRGCGKELPFAKNSFHIDHIVPVTLGGPDTPANVQLMCQPCNREKWANLSGQIHLPV